MDMLTRTLGFGGVAVAAMLGFASPAQASADSTCYPDWKVKQTDFRGCSGMALLSPGNDTRINLLMLLYDRHGDVGVSNTSSYDAMARRGEAQPFDYGVFALALGRKPPENEELGNYIGTRCVSNDQGQVEFESALALAKGISPAERTVLGTARKALQPECSEGSDMRSVVATAVESITSKAGRDFADYLRGAAAFYDGDFATARGLFAGLAKASSAWPKEAAEYMLGRVELNLAMENAFDEYGYPAENPDNKAALAAAERAFQAYIEAYPKGRYAVSAQGLLRKVYWLGSDNDKLLAEYVAAFKRANMSGSNVSLADLVQEMDVKLGAALKLDNVRDPQILALLVLKGMRHRDDPDSADEEKPINRAAIEALRSRFTGQEALYNYLLAAHAYYVAKDPAAALQALPANPVGDGYLAFSQRALRALALQDKGDPGARAAFAAVLSESKKPFQRGTMELALAMYDERGKALERVFAADSPIKDPEVREILLRYTAGPKLLRAQAASKSAPKQERDVALYTLLYKNITRGAYKDFLTDQALIPAGTKPHAADDYSSPTYTNIAVFKWAGAKDGFACPSLTTLATALSGAPKDAPSLLCLGEFVRLNGMDQGASWPDISGSMDQTPPKGELGGTPSQFPGKGFSRLEVYKGIVADPSAAATAKAYALYRAVYCYAPSGYNSCGGVEVPIAQRRAWFNQLKKSYPTSPWATKLKYYW
jgi:hypothetical protein